MNFRHSGYTVKAVADGETALAVMADFSPVVVLLDLRLPRMDGIEVLKRIKALTEDAHVIIMTAYGDTQTTVTAVKCGAYNFINKPFELEELDALVLNAFENSELKKEVQYLRYRQKKLSAYGDLIGKSPAMQGDLQPHRPHCRHTGHHGAHPGRERYRQGAGGRSHTPQEQPAKPALHGNQLLFHARNPAGE